MDAANPTIIGVQFNTGQSAGKTFTQVVVSWTPPDGSGLQFLLKLYKDDAEITSTNAIGASGTLDTSTITYAITSLYTVRVMENVNGKPGPPSDPVEVIWTAPTALAIAYDGTTIRAQWQPADPAGRASINGGEIVLYNGETLLQANGAQGFTGSLTPATPLDSTATYSVTVAATFGPSTGPPCAPVTVVQSRPTISKLSYDTGTIQVSAQSVVAPVLGAALYRGGELVQTSLSTSDLVVLKPPTALQPWSTYTVQIWGAQTDQKQPDKVISSGPSSDAVPVVTAVPAIQTVDFTDGQTIEVSWRNGPGLEILTGGQIMLLEEGTIKQSADADGTTGTITPSPPLGSNDQRTLRVASTRWMSSGPSSTDVDVLAARPTITQLSYDGGILSVGWTPVGGAPASYVVEVFAGGTLLASQPTAGASAALPVVLDDALSYSVAVKGVRGDVAGPLGSAQPAISAAPTVTQVAMGGGVAEVTLSPPTNTANIAGYQVQLLEEGFPAGGLVTATNMTARISYGFKPGYRYSVLARAVGTDPAKFWGPWDGQAGAGTPVLTLMPSGLTASYDKQLVKVSWDPASDARVDGYVVTLSVTGQPAVTQRVAQPYCQFELSPPAAAATASITVAAVAGGSTGSTGTSLSLVLHNPTISAAVFDGSTLSLGWSPVADAGVTGYVVSLLSGGAVTQQARFGGTSGVLSVPPGPFAATVQAVSDGATGPVCEPVALLYTAPHITSKGFDAATGNFSMTWEAVPQAGGYSIEVVGTGLGGKTGGTGFSVSPDKLPPAGVYYGRVRAIASPTNDLIAGPWSSPVTLLLIQPGPVAVEYDGRQARISWEPVASPLAIGYLVTVLGGASPITEWTATNSAVVAVPFDDSKQFNVVVQAVTDAGTGRPTTQTELFQSGFYLSTEESEAAHLCPASDPKMAPHDIVVYLPELFTTSVPSDKLPTTPPFVFSTTQEPFAYTLKMPSDSIVWTFAADPVRTNVKDAYTKLVSDLTTLDITPLGWRVVQDAIARAMPQTFSETLFYGYGFAPDDGYVDLKPGMVLRVEYEGYQYIGPNQTSSSYLSGFVGTNTAEYELGSYIDSNGNSLTGLDAFLSLVTQNGTNVPRPTGSNGKIAGGGGVIDFYFSQFRLPFLRLVYPTTLFSSSVTGYPAPDQNVAVLAAPDYVRLDAATKNLRNGQSLSPGTVAAYLRGRAVVSACTRVWLNGEARVVPVGTTAGSLLESMGSRPPALAQLALPGLRLTRATGYAVTESLTDGYPAGGGYPIRLDWAGASTHVAALDWLSLPLLLGDRLAVDERPA